MTALRFSALHVTRDVELERFVVDGRLSATGPSDATPLPGRFFVEGLVDAHLHLDFVADGRPIDRKARIDELRARIGRSGVTVVRDVGATSRTLLDAAFEAGLPRILGGGRCLLPERGHPFDYVGPDELVAAARAEVERGAKWVKVFADWPGWPDASCEPEFGISDRVSYSVETLAAATSAVHSLGGRVAAHAFSAPGARVAIEANADSIEHGWGLERSDLEAMVRSNIAWTPLLAIATPMIKLAERDRRPAQVEWIRDRVRHLRTLLPIAEKLGVRVLAGTDWFPDVTIGNEVGALVESGMSPVAAILAASGGARRFLGLNGNEDGELADFALYQGDPRKDPQLLDHPAAVVIQGRRFLGV